MEPIRTPENVRACPLRSITLPTSAWIVAGPPRIVGTFQRWKFGAVGQRHGLAPDLKVGHRRDRAQGEARDVVPHVVAERAVVRKVERVAVDGRDAVPPVGRVRPETADDTDPAFRAVPGLGRHDHVVAVPARIADPKRLIVGREDGALGEPGERPCDGVGAVVVDQNELLAHECRVQRQPHLESGIREGHRSENPQLCLSVDGRDSVGSRKTSGRPARQNHRS